MTTYTYIRRTFVTVPTGLSVLMTWQLNTAVYPNCESSSDTFVWGNATITHGSEGAVDVAAITNSGVHTLRHYTDANASITTNVHMKYELSNFNDMRDAVVAFDGNLAVTNGTYHIYCINIDTGVAPGPPSPCVSRIKAGQPAVVVLNDAILTAALALIPGSWWGFLLQWYVGMTLDTNIVCATLPPSVPEILTTWLRNPGQGALTVLYATLWPYMCECTPASPPALDPPKPTPPRPPDFPNPPVYPTPCTDPCLNMTDIRSRLDQLMRLVQRDLELDGLMQRYDLPFAIIPGAVHSGLTGSGSFAISRLAGIRIELTSSPPSRALEGNPPYLWDLGWASVNDGGAMLQEVRVTRSSFDWFPQHVQMATQFGYFAKPGATLRVTELQAEP